MSDNPSRPLRTIGIADHLWQTYQEMARQMGADRDALINQALFNFARLNGFIEVAPSGPKRVHSDAETGARSLPLNGARHRTPPKVELTRPAGGVGEPAVGADRVLESAAELERLIQGQDRASGESAEHPGNAARPHAAKPTRADSEDPATALYVMLEDGDPEKVVGNTALIGRGRHCEFVIDSGKVSREHARIIRESDSYFLEDLGSSNGTWFNKQRIKRRRIEDGDEFYICSEKVRFVIR